MLCSLFFVQVTMETNETGYIIFEEITPQYIEYIDSCKLRAQEDPEYWEILKNIMSQGKIEYKENNDEESNNEESVMSYSDEESQEDIHEDNIEMIKNLLEYQTKMLENMNFAIDDLTEKCLILSKYCYKLAKRLQKFNESTPVDIQGIVNTNQEDIQNFQPIDTDTTNINEPMEIDETIPNENVTEINIDLDSN